MLFSKLFKPKWQSSNPKTRRDAITALHWADSGQKETLIELIKTERDQEILQTLLKKADPAIELLPLLTSENTELNQAISRRIVVDLEGEQNQEKLRTLTKALEASTDWVIFEIVGQLGEKEASFLDALQAQSSNLLVKLATQLPTSKARQRAANRIADKTQLEQVSQHAKGKDKGVLQIVKVKLQTLRQEEDAHTRAKQEIESLCDSFENHANTESTKHYPEKLVALERILASLPWKNFPALAARIENAHEQCKERAASLLVAQAEEAKSDLKADERTAAIQELRQVHDRLLTAPMTEASELSALDALIKTQESRWLEATREQRVEKSEQKAYQQVMGELRQYHNALQRLIRDQDKHKQTLENQGDDAPNGARELSRFLSDIEWPEKFAPHPIVEKAGRLMEQSEAQRVQARTELQKVRKSLESKQKSLQQAIESGEVKKAVSYLRELHDLAEAFEGSERRSWQGKLKLEQSRVNELKDWQGFATRPKQEELIERMDALASSHLEPHLKADKIKALQKEWRELGGSSDQSLWLAFKTASERAYAPCREFFDEEQKLKLTNLSRREEICRELELLLEQADFSQPDWKALDKINRKAREEWRQYHPVDRRAGQPVQKRFNVALAALDKILDQEKNRNLQLKQAIVDKANTLRAIDDIRKATQDAKQLQKEWQTIGITQRDGDRKLWQEFRNACDEIFARLNERKSEQAAEVQRQIDRAEELITAIQALTHQPDAGAQAALASLSSAYMELDQLGKAEGRLKRKFQDAVQEVKTALQLEAKKENSAYYRQLFEIVIALPTLKHQDEELQRQVEGLKPDHQAIIRKFSAPESPTHASPNLRDTLLQMEIALNLSSPDDEQNRRMQLQVERLATEMGSSKSQVSGASAINHFLEQLIIALRAESLFPEKNQPRLLAMANHIS